jgi:ZIP family zinc transporter
LLAAAVVAGRVLAEPLSDDVLSVVLGLAGGAVLASLADTVMPEAFDSGGPFVALPRRLASLSRSSWAA